MEQLRHLADYAVTFQFPFLDNRKELLDVMHRTAKVPNVSIIGNDLRPTTESERLEQENSVKGGGGGLIGPYTDEKMVTMELNRYAKLYQEIVRRSAYLCASWQAAGFVHGVLNTDNMSIHGITLDYGPFLFMDTYDPCVCGSSTDVTGRYRFENQPRIVYWNLYKFGRCFTDLVVMDEVDDYGTPINGVDGKDIIERILDSFETIFLDEYTHLMGKKLGIMEPQSTDLEILIEPLLQLLCDTDTDYTIFFRALQQVRMTETDFKMELSGSLVADPLVPNGEAGSEIGPLKFSNLKDFQAIQKELASKRTNIEILANKFGIDEEAVHANAENAKFENDKSQSGCLDILLSSMKQAIQETLHEMEVLSFMQGGDNRGSVVKEPRKSVPAAAVADERLEKTGRRLDEGDVMTSNEEGNTHDEVDDVFPLVDIMVATDVHNYESSKRKNMRRASVIMMERERRQASAGKARSSVTRMSVTQRTSLRMSAVKFRDLETSSLKESMDSVLDKEDDGPTEVHEAFPGELEVKYRWQEWLIKYRERLVTESIAMNQETELTDQFLRNEDAKRRFRMRQRNPRFNLRGWILEEIAEKVAMLPECQPVDAEIARLQEELKVLADAEARTLASATNKKDDQEDDLEAELADLLAKLKRGEPLKPVDDKKRRPPKLSGEGVETLNQAMRILISDVWGEKTDSIAGWDSVFDREAANRWGGKVPKRKDNIVQSPAS
ncbi:UNVERIFIED_CONTAM: hypothetical protein HDU68_002866 [Siphonaria sp. JEL0065]|nr:hypothetical protein HDU68_002866 [Siphonaria sp. JEL0065]